MKDKIIVWIDQDYLTFGLAKSLQEKYECDLFAIFDVTDRPKKFFQQQQFVRFRKFWFFHDYILKIKTRPDLNYLASFEEKYKINLWLLACNDRIFYRYNDFYQFTSDEVLSILEQECRFFESVLDEIKPDFLVTVLTGTRRNHLFYEICKARGIKILMLNASRFGYRCIISQEEEKLDLMGSHNNISSKTRTMVELQDYLKGHHALKEGDEYTSTFLKSKRKLVKAAIQFLLISKNTNYKTHYTYYGRTKLRVLIHSILNLLKIWYRVFFMNRNFTHKIDTKEPFIFFPLQTEPERGLLIAAPFYTNQFELIMLAVKSLPIGYKLYVKDHPSMDTRGWRPVSYYKQIMNLPNVELIHPSVPPDEIMNKCSLVITVGGTAGFEAAFYGKPTITFVDALYSTLKSVYVLKNIEEFPKAIRTMLKKKVDFDDLNKFVDLIDKNSFEFNWAGFSRDLHEHFFYGGFLADVDITTSKMKSFLEKHNFTLEKLALEFVKKIEQHKEYESKK